MKTSSVFILALSSAVLATPTPGRLKEHPGFKGAGPGDVRSPCPLLNSLANHDILPHSGKEITIPILKYAFNHYINVGNDVAEAVGAMALSISKKQSFDLDQLDLHDAIEHDGSISRDDFYFGDDHTFNKTIFKQASQFFMKAEIHPVDAAEARITRHHNARATNPDYHLSTPQRQGTFTEAAFYLSVFGDPHTGIVPQSEWVRYWFMNRRLPYELGWTPRTHQTNLSTLAALAKKVHEVTPKGKGHMDDGKFVFYPH